MGCFIKIEAQLRNKSMKENRLQVVGGNFATRSCAAG